MAKIFLNIEADSPNDLHDTLAAILAGQNAEYDAAADYSRVLQASAYVPEGPKPTPTAAAEPSPASGAAEASPPAKTDEIKHDSAGVAFDETVHTGTMNKDGTWRRKKGAPVVEAGNGATGTASSGTEPAQAASAPTADAGPADEDDEFAAFAAAAAEPAAVAVPARVWTDADLGKLCNQAAVKLGSPDKVRELIAKYVPEGETAHSRNIPTDDREAFAAAVEEAAGITFAG